MVPTRYGLALSQQRKRWSRLCPYRPGADPSPLRVFEFPVRSASFRPYLLTNAVFRSVAIDKVQLSIVASIDRFLTSIKEEARSSGDSFIPAGPCSGAHVPALC